MIHADGVGVRLPSDPKYLPLLRAVVDQGATLAGITSLDRDRVLLALTEAVTTAFGGDFAAHGGPSAA